MTAMYYGYYSGAIINKGKKINTIPEVNHDNYKKLYYIFDVYLHVKQGLISC